jgi:hypothetical protein
MQVQSNWLEEKHSVYSEDYLEDMPTKISYVWLAFLAVHRLPGYNLSNDVLSRGIDLRLLHSWKLNRIGGSFHFPAVQWTVVGADAGNFTLRPSIICSSS